MKNYCGIKRANCKYCSLPCINRTKPIPDKLWNDFFSYHHQKLPKDLESIKNNMNIRDLIEKFIKEKSAKLLNDPIKKYRMSKKKYMIETKPQSLHLSPSLMSFKQGLVQDSRQFMNSPRSVKLSPIRNENPYTKAIGNMTSANTNERILKKVGRLRTISSTNLDDKINELVDKVEDLGKKKIDKKKLRVRFASFDQIIEY